MSIEKLKFDKKNFNKHTEFGMSLLEKFLRQNGAGRSILVDKDDNIIAGNGIVEAAVNAGITKTKVVEVTGDELVVVKRTDLELDSKQGREMALADNATAAVDLAWNFDELQKAVDEFEIKPDDCGVIQPTEIDPDEFFENTNKDHKNSENIIIALSQDLLNQKEEIKSVVAECLKPYKGAKIK